MSTEYANLIDPQLLNNNIDADYANEARLVASSIVSVEGVPDESSQLGWVKNKMFAGSNAQAVGVGTSLTIKNKVQSEFQFPIVKRGNAGELDGTFEQIRKKATRLSWTEREVQENITNSLTDGLMTNAGQGLDDVGINILLGTSAFCKTNSINYNDDSGSQVSLVAISETMALRGEASTQFSQNGFICMTGVMYQKMIQLGLVAFTTVTTGMAKQDMFVESGDLGRILGMRPFTSDKITQPEANDERIILIEQGGLRMVASPIDVKRPQKIPRRDAFEQEYYFRAGGIVNGFSWATAKANVVTDADLSTGTNYEVFAENNKNLPFAVLEVDEP